MLYSAKLSFKLDWKIKYLYEKEHLMTFMPTKPAFQKFYKNVLEWDNEVINGIDLIEWIHKVKWMVSLKGKIGNQQ